MVTKLRDVGDMDTVLKTLQPYLPKIYEAIVRGTTQSTDLLEAENIDLELGLHASLTRAYVLRFLRDPKSKFPYTIRQLNNNGLHTQVDDVVIRIRKAVDGKMPKPSTQELRDYYNQVNGQLKLGGDFNKMTNLLVLWDCNHKGDFKNLSLIYPYAYNIERWRYRVPNPLTSSDTQSNETTGAENSQTDTFIRIEDLPLIRVSQIKLPLDDLSDQPIDWMGKEGFEGIKISENENEENDFLYDNLESGDAG